MRTTLFALALAVLSGTAPLAAQQSSPPRPPADEELVNRVVAVVGDTVLLLSDVQAELQQLEVGGQLPADPLEREQVAQEIVEARVNDLLLLEAAQRAGIEVRNEQVEEVVEQTIRSVRRQFRTEAEMNAALARAGLSFEAYRRELAAQQRNRLLSEQFLQQRLRNRARPVVSEEQIRRAFETQRGALGDRPATVSLQQVIVQVEPSPEAEAAARDTAESVLRQINEGADFAVLARRYSDDPGSREHGGDLGWFRRGRMVPEFEQMAFALRPGSVSPIVETEFGFHIIKVEKARGGERQARHILITPELTEADEARARARADSVLAAIRGGAPVAELARKYDTPSSEAEVTRIPVDRLPPAFDEALAGAEVGGVVGPVRLESPTGARFAVVKVTAKTEAGQYTLEDVREQLLGRLQEQRMIEQLVEELRREIYVALYL